MKPVRLFCLLLVLVFTAAGTGDETEKANELNKSLLQAAAEGNVDKVKSLISKGADVNAQDDYGQTPLHCATVKGHKNVVEFLLTKGARIDPRDNAGRTPLHYASGAGGAYGVIGGDIDTAQFLLDKGANINTADKLGWTPLHYATRMRNKNIVELLVNRGADSNISNKRGHTAFSLTRGIASVFSGHDKQVEFTKRYREIADILRRNVTVFCVAVEGKDSNPGTLQLPYKTLGAALGIAEPGDMILVRGGVHFYSRTIHIDKSGQASNPICIKAYPGETPVFDFSMGKGDGFYITGAYWHIKGLTVTKTEHWGIRLETERSHHNILEQIIAHTNGLTGIALFNGAEHNLVLNCDSYQNFDPETDGENADGFAAVSGLGKGNILIGCRAWNNSDDGFDLWDAGNSVRLENCYSYRNGQNIWGHPFFTGNANGFKLGLGIGGHVLIGCVAFDHGFGGFNLNGNETGVILYGCTAFKNSPNYRFPDQDRGIDNCILRNNISAQGKTRDGIGIKADGHFNSWNAALNLSVAIGDFLSLDDDVMTQARNQDGSIPESDFLRLAPGSDAIDAGTDVGLPFIGKAPDLGAFEYNPAAKDRSYVKMLHQYVRDHDMGKIRETLAAGTDVNEKDWLGYAPLHWAVYFGYLDVAELLLDKQANPNLKSDTGRTPLEIATEMGYEKLAELLRKHGAKE